jgi:hypothetical protein
MVRRVLPFVVIWLQAAVELILFFPVFMLIDDALLSVNLWFWMLGLTLFYMAGYGISRFLKLDKWYSLTVAALCISGAIAVGLFGLSKAGYVTGAIGFYLFFRGVFMANRSWKMMFHSYYYWSGLFLYFAVSVIFRFRQEAQAYESELFWLGLLSVAVTLLITSQEQIIQESLPEKTGNHLVNPAMLWQNRLLTIALLVVITCVAAFNQLSQSFVWVNRWFWQTLFYLIAKLFPKSKEAPPDITPAANPALLPPPAGKPSAFLLWLEKIAYYLVLALIAAALLICIYFIGKWIIRYTRIIYRWLLLRVNNTKKHEWMGYEDESVRLFNWQNIKESYGGKVRDWLDQMLKRELKWSELKTNAERVRFIYRQLLMRSAARGFEAKPYYTVQEVIQAMKQWKPDSAPKGEKLAQLYNKARYSNHSIETQEVEELK